MIGGGVALVPNYNRYLYNRDSFVVRNKCWCPHKNSVCYVFYLVFFLLCYLSVCLFAFVACFFFRFEIAKRLVKRSLNYPFQLYRCEMIFYCALAFEQDLQSWRAKRAARERASEWRSLEGQSVSFRARLLRELSRLPQMKSLLAG